MESSTKSRRLSLSAWRWARLSALALLGAVAFELILPVASDYAARMPVPYSPGFFTFVILVSVVALVWAITEPVHIRQRQWRRMVWYPPTWVAIPVAWVLAALAEHLPSGLRPVTVEPDWQHIYPVVPIVAALVLGVVLRQLSFPATSANPNLQDSDNEGDVTWPEIERWISSGERPIESHERDLFRHRPVARRIANAVSEGRHVALLGGFGAGKSSILNVVRSSLAHSRRTIIVADCDVWAVPKPEDVPRLALNRMLAALDDYVDTIEFRRLPVTYQRLAAAEPSGKLAKILGVEDSSDSVESIAALQRTLEVLDARLVLLVQDVERAGQSFDTRHLQRLLWALRSVRSISFVLATDPEHTTLDFTKLCDSIELIPAVHVKDVAIILSVAYGHWRSRFADIDPHPDRRQADKLGLGVALLGDLMDYLQRTGRDTPLDALVSILETPRALKHVLRRVNDVWHNLHGEAELDDIVVVAALRHGAEPVFRFLLADIDPARHKPDDLLPRTKTVKPEWERLLEDKENAAAVRRLVDLMGIEQLATDHIRVGAQSPQGIHEYEPTDYFRRIAAEEMDVSELRDQTVLRDIDQWNAHANGQLLQRLLTESDAGGHYVAVWEHFSARHSDRELMRLTEAVVQRLLERDGSDASADDRALIALWRRCNRRLRGAEYEDWLSGMIVNALSVSLHFATGLYYYWAGGNGIVADAAKEGIRAAVVRAVRQTIHDGTGLVTVLSRRYPYSVGHLITQTGRDAGVEAFKAWSDFLPSILLDAATATSDVVIAEIANLAGDEQSGMVAAGQDYPPIFINRYRIERQRFEALFGDRIDDALALLAAYAGDDAYGVRAKDDARVWLEERRRDQPTSENPQAGNPPPQLSN